MKICFIAPGEIEIPPSGWGALETVVWNQSEELKKLGHETFIINSKDKNETFIQLKKINPDIIHLHYGKHYELMPLFSCKKIVTNHDGSFKNSGLFHDRVVRSYLYDCEFFCLSEHEENFFLNIGISPSKVKIMKNGAEFKKFNKTENPTLPDKSICIGKIDSRKRQAKLQSMNAGVDFVGSINDPNFDTNSNYLGPWGREEIFENLTEYGNFVLLSSSENCCPLVCLEAMSAGLGIVISEACVESIDLSKKFITLIPESKIKDEEFIKKSIEENRDYSITHRKEIIEYASTRDWSEIAKYYSSCL